MFGFEMCLIKNPDHPYNNRIEAGGVSHLSSISRIP